MASENVTMCCGGLYIVIQFFRQHRHGSGSFGVQGGHDRVLHAPSTAKQEKGIPAKPFAEKMVRRGDKFIVNILNLTIDSARLYRYT